MIDVFIILCCIFSSMIFITSIIDLWDISNKNSKKWECVKVNDSYYVMGKLNDKGDSECMYIPETVGCFIITNPEECKNIIDNYPEPVIQNQKTNLGIYSCGKNSTNEELWKNTGYEKSDSACSVILREKSLVSESKKWLSKTFGKII